MLKYHLLQPQHNIHHHAQFTHYLSLGSHHAPYTLNYITHFSIVTLNPKERLPEISQTQNKVVVPLRGTLKIDGVLVSQQTYQKQQCFYSVKSISNESQNAATFAYLGAKGQAKKLIIKISTTSQNQTLELSNELLYIMKGKLSYSQSSNEITIKNHFGNEKAIAALYSIEPIEVKLSSETLYLKISDIL